MDRAYELLDNGHGRKLERFGEVVVDRPCGQAVWHPRLGERDWAQADGVYTREGAKQWQWRAGSPREWLVGLETLELVARPTDFGHVGLFPEHRLAWRWLGERLRAAGPGVNVLNLFAYSGAATLAAAQAGGKVCHLDAAKKMVDWARENAERNGLGAAPIRWIVDDALKFLQREARRGVRYEGIILDPPSFGRGTKMEVFKIDDHIWSILDGCRAVLAERAAFVVLTSHTPGFTPLVLSHLLTQLLAGKKGTIDCREMVLEGGAGVLPVPNGAFAAWRREGLA